MVIIKPHHFIDILKLYGAGIESFVPDEKMGHDFYKIANIIINDHQTVLRLTVFGDDICQPCLRFLNGVCQDNLDNYGVSKDRYNRRLDERLMDLYQLSFDKDYLAKDLAFILAKNKDLIKKVWLEEDDDLTKKRLELFSKGIQKYLQ